MPAKANVLFPIETINRELDFRLLLAGLCANRERRIFIGDSDAIFNLTQQVKGGLYVGKNIRPTPTPAEANNNQRYKHFKDNGTRLVWLDEEGGIFWGQQEEWKWTMLQSIDPAQLAPADQICTWGDVQRDFYRSVGPGNAERIQTTGHPRFDLYKPHYREYYAGDVQELRGCFGDFVLINTNFHRAYTVQNLKKIFGTRSQLDPTGFDHGEAVERWHHLIGIFSDFIKLVSRLRQEFPAVNFIIRPHPSENMKFYKNIFDSVSNVHVLHEGAVGPWLLACRALIYDGCTTAIEGHFCGTPVINYKPLADERFDCMLPNQFGYRCTTENEVLEYIQGLLKASPTAETAGEREYSTKEKTAREMAATLTENFRQDSFPVLAKVITDTADQTPRDSGDILRQLVKKQQGRERLEKMQSRFRARRARRDSDSGMMDKFYGFDNVYLDRKIQAVQTRLNKELSVTIVSPELMCVESVAD